MARCGCRQLGAAITISLLLFFLFEFAIDRAGIGKNEAHAALD
jgi:hypothetical protein